MSLQVTVVIILACTIFGKKYSDTLRQPMQWLKTLGHPSFSQGHRGKKYIFVTEIKLGVDLKNISNKSFI